MAMKRIGFLMPGMGIYGGINIVLNWAAILAKSGYRSTSSCRRQKCPPGSPS